MKTLIFLVLLASTQVYSKECVVDTKSSGANPNDCIHCTTDVKSPAGKAGSTFDGVMNFVTNKDDQQKTVSKFKATLNFLNSKKNKAECSNYNVIATNHKNEFKLELAECEEGPDLLDRRKMLCEYVLNAYSNAVIDTFYSYWSRTGANGKPEFIPGRYKEQIEGPIRAHDSWCKKVKANYKNKMYISCGEVSNWVDEFNITKRVGEAMKRDMETKEESISPAEKRKKMLENACKYFDTHDPTTFTKDLYLQCI
jgi:hypothetical protein